jgi:sterol desaturase/sphingolipid hydroxylase (fatty acid hydroxylase superfamily)
MKEKIKQSFFLRPDKRNRRLTTIGEIILFPSIILLFFLLLGAIGIVGPTLIILTLLVFIGYYFCKKGQGEPVSSSFWLIVWFVMSFLVVFWNVVK